MTIRSLLLLGSLFVASVAMAHTKSYDITLPSPTMVGNVQLAAGDYSLKVQGNDAVFTNKATRKTTTAPCTAQTVKQKFGTTAALISKEGDVSHLQAVDLGGSTTQLDFK